MGGACALASPDVRKEAGRGCSNLGNIPEAAGCVYLWRAGRFWCLKFLVLESSSRKRPGRQVVMTGRSPAIFSPTELRDPAAVRWWWWWWRLSVAWGSRRLGRGSSLPKAHPTLSLESVCAVHDARRVFGLARPLRAPCACAPLSGVCALARNWGDPRWLSRLQRRWRDTAQRTLAGRAV